MSDVENNPVISVPSSVLDTRALTTTNVAQSAPVLANQPTQGQGPVRKNASLLVVWAESDQNSASDNLLYIKFRYPNAAAIRVTSWAEFASTLSQFQSIQNLVLLTHSSSGALEINKDPKTGGEVAAILRPLKLSVKQNVIFDGCDFLAEPLEAMKIIQSVGAIRGIGYTWWHWLGRYVHTLPAAKPADSYRATLDQWFNENASFLVPPLLGRVDQPTSTEELLAWTKYVSQSGGRRAVTLGWEWFRRGIGTLVGGKPVRVPDRSGQNDVYRSQLSPVLITNEQEADSFMDSDPTLTPQIVTVRIPVRLPPPVASEVQGAPVPGQ